MRARESKCVFQSLVCLLVLAASISGCANPQRITYTVANAPRVTKSPVAHVRLRIGVLRDVRRRVAGNAVLFTAPNETTIKDGSYCINSEQNYDPNTVGQQMSIALAQHLRHRGSLRVVDVGRRVQGAYYLSGTLRRFYAAQESTSISPTTGVLFGAIGAAIASASVPDVTPGNVSIEIVDWVLYDTTGRATRLPDIVYKRTLKLPAAGDCLVVYANVNEHLKKVFEKHAYVIERAIATAEHGAATSRGGAQPGGRDDTASRIESVRSPEATRVDEQGVPAEVAPAEVAPAEVAPAEVAPAEVAPPDAATTPPSDLPPNEPW